MLTILEYCNILICMNEMDRQDAGRIAAAIKSIGHPDRISILLLLGCFDRLTVSDLQRRLSLTQSMTSQHLAAMRLSNILATERDKNKVYYSIANKDVLKIVSCIKKCRKRH